MLLGAIAVAENHVCIFKCELLVSPCGHPVLIFKRLASLCLVPGYLSTPGHGLRKMRLECD